MVNKKTIGIVAIVVIIVAIAAILASGVFSTPTEPTDISAAINKDCTVTAWVVGEKEGFFKKYGVNVIDKGNIPAPQRPAAFTSGQLNVIEAQPNTLINFIQSGVKAKGVVVTETEPDDGDISKQHMHWLVRDDSPLKSAKDIKKFKETNGRKVKVAISATGTCAEIETNAWFRKNNISKEYYEVVVLGDDQQEVSLQQGTIDIACLHPPFYAKAEKDSKEAKDANGKFRILFTSTDAFGKAAGLTFAVFTEDYIKENPDTVRDFVNAFKDAERWANEHREEAGKLTSEKIGLPYAANTHWYSPSGAITPEVKELVQQWIDALVADGIIKEGEFKPEDLYTTEFNDTWKTDLPDF
ncbi:MAG: ABC transporter substrate-binding protein [Methanobrevibacter sp.]|jgi:ABC-type nitrate/sulfonate/bicarbonate transport system substrate-binding protein|nr:ABC transporter substrate-binding protein [Methanobrevibacter sp.]